MPKSRILKLPSQDPLTGEPLLISELISEESGITIRGRFELPRYARLNQEQLDFLETFLRCRGMMNGVERELGISYPTVKARLDALLEALGLEPAGEPKKSNGKLAEKRRKILEQLESGEITAQEAKAKLKGKLKA